MIIKKSIWIKFNLIGLVFASCTTKGKMILNEKEKTITLEYGKFYKGAVTFDNPYLDDLYYLDYNGSINKIDLKGKLLLRKYGGGKIITYYIQPNNKYRIRHNRGDQSSDFLYFITDSLNNIREITEEEWDYGSMPEKDK